MRTSDGPSKALISRKTQLLLLVAVFALWVDYFLSVTIAEGNSEWAVALSLMALIIGLQVFFIARIYIRWDQLSTVQRWRTGVAAFIVPPLAGFAVPIAIGLVIVFVAFKAWLIVSGRAAGPRWNTSRASTPNFGDYWGNDKVVNDADGRPLWVGNDEIQYGSDGRPQWLGAREIQYGSDGRPTWIGNDEVIFGGNTNRPSWVGDRRVT